MVDPKIMHYFKKGVERGFNRDYIKKVLLKKGYNGAEVSLAYSILREEEAKETKPELKKSVTIPLLIGVFVIVVFAVLLTVFYYEQVRGGIGAMSQEEVEERVSAIEDLSSELDEKQLNLDEKIKEIERLDATVEEKEKLIQEQIKKIKELNEEMKKEREEVKELLMDVLNIILGTPRE